jgi:hypothetical protein
MRRVPYHQSVFDLLDIQPRQSPQAREMIEMCERRCGRRLPEAVRQWYLLDGVVELWDDYSNMDGPEPLDAILRQLAQEGEGRSPWWAADRLWVLCENQGCWLWFVLLDGSDDPPVFLDAYYDHRQNDSAGEPPPEKVADRFSDFLFDWFARFYFMEWTPLSERSLYPPQRTRRPREKPYRNGLWLYAPDAETLLPPYLDYLIDSFAEESRREVASGVVQHCFRDDHGHIRVTTDDCREEGGVSAWWLDAGSVDHLLRLAKKVWWCCDLPAKLRAWSEAARPVLERLRGADGALGTTGEVLR